MNRREHNHLLMAHWTEAWRMLGRWQALNARLSRDLSPRDFDKAKREPGIRVRGRFGAGLHP
jgi:hypothetical protein